MTRRSAKPTRPTQETTIRFINYPKVLASSRKALKALDCQLDVGARNWDQPTTAYALLTAIDAAALQRRIEVMGGVGEHDKATVIKQVYGTLYTEQDAALDVLFAERLGELLAILQAVKDVEPSGKYQILYDHIGAAAALAGATLAAIADGPKHRAAALGMVRKAVALSDKANAGLRNFLST